MVSLPKVLFHFVFLWDLVEKVKRLFKTGGRFGRAQVIKLREGSGNGVPSDG